MKKLFLIIVALVYASIPAVAQETGSVSGIVYDSDDNLIADAHIYLSGEVSYFAETGSDGTFIIEDVGEGTYTAIASKMELGHDTEDIEVIAGQNAEVTFVLEMGGHGGVHHGGGHGHGQYDSLEVVELSGWAIVETDDYYSHYYLDVNNDDIADFRLGFGPAWYDPDNGAARPENGDEIDIVGGLMGYSEPQMVVVYEINGLFWREPGMGHGGHGGHGGDGGCDPDSLVLIETSGVAILEEMPGHDWSMYYIDNDDDLEADYHLNFGAPWYDPGNGATRPEDGDEIEIVGGLMDGCDGLATIIVYEINGQFWRDPGDTTGLWLSPTSVDGIDNLLTPNKYIVAHSYPNPFNPTTSISFDLPEAGYVKVAVYDLLGRQVTVLVNGAYPAGTSQVTFDVNKTNGFTSTTYFYRIETDYSSVTGKMILLK